jgi:hypothetical protein
MYSVGGRIWLMYDVLVGWDGGDWRGSCRRGCGRRKREEVGSELKKAKESDKLERNLE